MKKENLMELEATILEVVKEHPNIFRNDSLKKDWYHSRKDFLKQNDSFLELVSEKHYEKTQIMYDKEELFMMQKLYLLYPNNPPEKLLSLSWEHIKVILNLCEKEKRDFYTELCILSKIDVSLLKKYILNDLYEKKESLMTELENPEKISTKNFLKYFLEIYPMIWQ